MKSKLLMQTAGHSTRARRAGFTLVELLIVLGIIAVLISVIVVVGQGVAQGAKRSATLSTIQVLDEAMAAYVASEDASFPRVVTFPLTPGAVADRALPVFDGVAKESQGATATTYFPINTVGLFMLEASKVPKCREILAKLPAKFVRNFDIDDAGPQTSLPTVFDAWDRPIRMVLPFSDGIIVGPKAGTGAAVDSFRPIADVAREPSEPTGVRFVSGDVRRNNTTVRLAGACTVTSPADSDGGRCVGNKPYFYSVGADGIAGAASTPASCGSADGSTDNVYSQAPTPAK